MLYICYNNKCRVKEKDKKTTKGEINMQDVLLSDLISIAKENDVSDEVIRLLIKANNTDFYKGKYYLKEARKKVEDKGLKNDINFYLQNSLSREEIYGLERPF